MDLSGEMTDHIQGYSNGYAYRIRLTHKHNIRFSLLDVNQLAVYESNMTKDDIKANPALSALYAEPNEIMKYFFKRKQVNILDFMQIQNVQTAFIQIIQPGDQKLLKIRLNLKSKKDQHMRQLEERLQKCQEIMMEQSRKLQTFHLKGKNTNQMNSQPVNEGDKKEVDEKTVENLKIQKNLDGNLAQNRYVKAILVFVLILFVVQLLSIKSKRDHDHSVFQFNQNVTNQLQQFKAEISTLHTQIGEINKNSEQTDVAKANRIDQIEKFLIRLQSRLITVEQHFYQAKSTSNNKGHHHNGHQKPTPPPRHYSRHY